MDEGILIKGSLHKRQSLLGEVGARFYSALVHDQRLVSLTTYRIGRLHLAEVTAIGPRGLLFGLQH